MSVFILGKVFRGPCRTAHGRGEILPIGCQKMPGVMRGPCVLVRRGGEVQVVEAGSRSWAWLSPEVAPLFFLILGTRMEPRTKVEEQGDASSNRSELSDTHSYTAFL